MEPNNSKFPTKKDMTYWIFIVVIILAIVSVWKTEDSASLAGDLSLGGTLLSIFLAIIAIIFSFIQSSDANSQNEKMMNKMADLTDSIRYLDLLNKVKTEEVATKSSELNEIKELIDSLAQEVTNLQEQPNQEQINRDKLIELARKIGNSQKKPSQSEFPIEIKIYGKNALYNFLISRFGKGEMVILQTLRSEFNKMNNMEISSDEMLRTLNGLVSENKVKLTKNTEGTFITIL